MVALVAASRTRRLWRHWWGGGGSRGRNKEEVLVVSAARRRVQRRGVRKRAWQQGVGSVGNYDVEDNVVVSMNSSITS